MNQYVATEDEHQLVWRRSLAENQVAIIGKPLRSVGCEPCKFSLGQPLQIFDSAQGLDDFCDAFVFCPIFDPRIYLLRHLDCSLLDVRSTCSSQSESIDPRVSGSAP